MTAIPMSSPRGPGMYQLYMSHLRPIRMPELSATSTTGTPIPRPTPRLRKAQTVGGRHAGYPAIGSVHWLFRTNIPQRRSSYYQPDVRKRNFFGMGDIIGVLTNPAETVRSLTESKRLLEEARREINETRERAQLRPKHTFSRLPGFFARDAELRAIERALEGDPAFTVLFGASSVGKTALLRQVLTDEKYHVLHFDLRISGFADLASLYMSLSEQMEQYFDGISKQMEGYEEFEKESWSFKHDRLNVERRLQESPPDSGIQKVKTSDIARLMELFQSSLLKYWRFDPFANEEDGKGKRGHKEEYSSSSATTDRTHVNPNGNHQQSSDHGQGQGKKKWKLRNLLRDRNKEKKRTDENPQRRHEVEEQEPPREERERPAKKMPVIFFDEAHKLPALIQSSEAMNCLLSTFLVLTKQDRLCHVIHATSDPFYHTWLRQLNIMQHCKIITIGDCSKTETRNFFREKLLPDVPEHLRGGLEFERLWEAFGGKLVHWQDYLGDYVNSNGMLDPKSSSHFLQAHALLNLHIIHSSQAPHASGSDSHNQNQDGQAPPPAPTGFRIYSPISHPYPLPSQQAQEHVEPEATSNDFTAIQLLKVMARITQPGVEWLPYFMLCREFGVRAVDGMVKGRVLELRWTEAVASETKEDEGEEEEERIPEVIPNGGGGGFDSRPGSVPGYMQDPSSPTTMLNTDELFAIRGPPPPPPPAGGPTNDSEEEMVMVPVSETEAMEIPPPRQRPPPPPRYASQVPQPQPTRRRRSTRYQSRYTTYTTRTNDMYPFPVEVIGPKVVPITPVMRYAMREVVKEYQEDDPEEFDGDEEGLGLEGDEFDIGSRRPSRSRRGTGTGTDGASEYASLSDVDEY
ncbi:hypothetical protein PM082_008972 [Marasmius tenuissimus]|nr:hypothetical protein PM082_008972 [Marasmius tenuissimus]